MCILEFHGKVVITIEKCYFASKLTFHQDFCARAKNVASKLLHE